MRAGLKATTFGVLLLVLTLAPHTRAQSTDQDLPTPVLSNDISGRINALDLGDARMTRHYYAFSANPGDLLITLDSRNLNGDVDVFTSVTFRPLMKTTMYTDVAAREITKGIYLRTKQILILRVEARTPNDDPGTYHIHFGGTFEPFSGGIPVAENAPATESATGKEDANRLSSVGATIPRTKTESTETAEPKPSPEKTSEETESANKPVEKPTTATSRRTASRNPRRNTRTSPSRRTPAKPATETAKEKPEENKETPATPTESATTTPPSEKPANQELPQPPGTHLIIQQKDGTTINRPMSTVRRVVIEGATIVIVLKTGKIERIAMSNVARMSIEPE